MAMKTSQPNDEVITAVEPLPEQEQPPTMEEGEAQLASLNTALPPSLPSEEPLLEELPLEDEVEEELIIEDFTIDGICGVY